MAIQSPSYRRRDRSIRFAFEYEGETIRLVTREYLEKVPPVSDPLEWPGDMPRSGFWIELQDASGRPLYRKVMHNPVRFYAEVPAEDEQGGGFINLPIENPRGVFFAIVPNVAGASQLVIYSSPLGYDAVPAPAEPIARFAIRNGQERV
jgi:hypothetical protein